MFVYSFLFKDVLLILQLVHLDFFMHFLSAIFDLKKTILEIYRMLAHVSKYYVFQDFPEHNDPSG